VGGRHRFAAPLLERQTGALRPVAERILIIQMKVIRICLLQKMHGVQVIQGRKRVLVFHLDKAPPVVLHAFLAMEALANPAPNCHEPVTAVSQRISTLQRFCETNHYRKETP
jgi:hypothetical protein